MVPEGPSARANPARGIALIATALILGLFVLRQGFETIGGQEAAEGVSSADQADDGAPPANGDAQEAEEPSTEPEEPEPLNPSELTVRVANTTDVPGAAANWSCMLDSQYSTVEAKQAAGDRGQRDTTVVMYVPGLDREATNLAGSVGEGVAVEPAPEEAPLDAEGQSLFGEGAQLVLMLGTDRAAAADPCPE